MKYMIGVDIGTTSTKSVLYDEHGQFITKHHIGYPYIRQMLMFQKKILTNYSMPY